MSPKPALTKVKASPEVFDTESEATFFLPDLCGRESVFFLVVIAELASLVMVLIDSGLFHFSWEQLGLVSLFVQWIALTSAAILCQIRGFLRTLTHSRAVLISYLLIPVNTWLMSFIGMMFIMPVPGMTIWDTLLSDRVITNVVISMIIGGLVIRYFYLQAMLLARRQSELLHRVQALQSRIRPHFLFNSMNIIASLIETDPKSAEHAVEDLSALFRASLNFVGNQVPLDEEINLCCRYLNIEKLRLGKRLHVHWDIRSVPKTVKIPLLTLQPLLENAVLHGIQPLPKGGMVEIIASYHHGIFEVQISNPYAEKNPLESDDGNKMALENTRHRLMALYGERAKLTGYMEGGRYITRLSYPYSA